MIELIITCIITMIVTIGVYQFRKRGVSTLPEKQGKTPNVQKNNKQVKHPVVDIEDTVHNTSKSKNTDEVIDSLTLELYNSFVKEENNEHWNLDEQMSIIMRRRKRTGLRIVSTPSKREIQSAYQRLIKSGTVESNHELEKLIRVKGGRSDSGVVVITVVMSPYPNSDTPNEDEKFFTCKNDCHYCPFEVTDKKLEIIGVMSFIFYMYNMFLKLFNRHAKDFMPRSYRSYEDIIMRARQVGYNAVKQIFIRASDLAKNGHDIDKIEVIVKGGTWGHFPEKYQREFARDLFYAANMFTHVKDRILESTSDQYDEIIALLPRKPYDDIALEHTVNKSCPHKIIGLTIETRPDHIFAKEIIKLRELGVTRIELGVQHTDDKVLKLINRGCYTRHFIHANKLLHDVGYKVDAHLMLNLPYPVEINQSFFGWMVNVIKSYIFTIIPLMETNPEGDIEMVKGVLTKPKFQVDQLKIYPVEIDLFTRMYKWFLAGIYKLYSYMKLVDVICEILVMMPPYVRVNRILRNLSSRGVDLGNDELNQQGVENGGIRDVVMKTMEKRGLETKEIRSREIGNRNPNKYIKELKIRQFDACDGIENFISFESPDEKVIFGFLRLRLSDNPGAGIFPELKDCALIRELHTYGLMIATTRKDRSTQNKGFGRRMLAEAERIAIENNYSSIAVISGVGAREYYEKFGYVLKSYGYMIKNLTNNNNLIT